jgi:hypothetical protein
MACEGWLVFPDNLSTRLEVQPIVEKVGLGGQARVGVLSPIRDKLKMLN